MLKIGNYESPATMVGKIFLLFETVIDFREDKSYPQSLMLTGGGECFME